MIAGIPTPVFLVLAFCLVVGIAFTYGCAKAEGARWHAEAAALVAVVGWGLDILFWEYDWIAAPCGAASVTGALVLVVLANGWWKP